MSKAFVWPIETLIERCGISVVASLTILSRESCVVFYFTKELVNDILFSQKSARIRLNRPDIFVHSVS